MARNSEKRYSALNRFLEGKQKQDGKEKNKKRPPLYQLATADEVKKWIPSIKKEIDYLLQQISGAHFSRNYSDQKIEEFKSRVDQLQKEHKHFVTKVRTLDPSYQDITPWELRVYRRKRSHDRHVSMEKTHDDHKHDNVEDVRSGIGKEWEKCHMITMHDQGYPQDTHMSQGDNQRTVHDNQKCDVQVASQDGHMTQLVSHTESSHDCAITSVANNPLHLDYLSSGSSDEEETSIKRVKFS